MVSTWFCVRCGRAGRFTHEASDKPIVIERLATSAHTGRLSMERRRKQRPCTTDLRLIGIARDSGDITALRESLDTHQPTEERG